MQTTNINLFNSTTCLHAAYTTRVDLVMIILSQRVAESSKTQRQHCNSKERAECNVKSNRIVFSSYTLVVNSFWHSNCSFKTTDNREESAAQNTTKSLIAAHLENCYWGEGASFAIREAPRERKMNFYRQLQIMTTIRGSLESVWMTPRLNSKREKLKL